MPGPVSRPRAGRAAQLTAASLIHTADHLKGGSCLLNTQQPSKPPGSRIKCLISRKIQSGKLIGIVSFWGRAAASHKTIQKLTCKASKVDQTWTLKCPKANSKWTNGNQASQGRVRATNKLSKNRFNSQTPSCSNILLPAKNLNLRSPLQTAFNKKHSH